MLTAPAGCCCASADGALPSPSLQPIAARGGGRRHGSDQSQAAAPHWRHSGPRPLLAGDTLHLELYNNYLPQNHFLITVFCTETEYVVCLKQFKKYGSEHLCPVLALQSAELVMVPGAARAGGELITHQKLQHFAFYETLPSSSYISDLLLHPSFNWR